MRHVMWMALLCAAPALAEEIEETDTQVRWENVVNPIGAVWKGSSDELDESQWENAYTPVGAVWKGSADEPHWEPITFDQGSFYVHGSRLEALDYPFRLRVAAGYMSNTVLEGKWGESGYDDADQAPWEWDVGGWTVEESTERVTITPSADALSLLELTWPDDDDTVDTRDNYWVTIELPNADEIGINLTAAQFDGLQIDEVEPQNAEDTASARAEGSRSEDTGDQESVNIKALP